MAVAESGGTCQICDMFPKFTLSVNEQVLSLQLDDPLLEYVKTDAFSHGDRSLTSARERDRFNVGTSGRRLGRVLDGVDLILATRAWPEVATAGITADVVKSGSGKPGDSCAISGKPVHPYLPWSAPNVMGRVGSGRVG